MRTATQMLEETAAVLLAGMLANPGVVNEKSHRHERFLRELAEEAVWLAKELRRAVYLAQDEKPDGTLASSQADAEREAIAEALARNNGSRVRAADELGISRVTLFRRMKQYGLR